jgi:hypothetical protein
MLKRRKVVVAAAVVGLAAAGTTAAAIATIKPYAVGIAGGYEAKRLLSVGDRVPETSNPAKEYQMVGIPDGLGAHANPDGTKTVFMNHELNSSSQSEPVIGEPLNNGAIVSKLVLDGDGNVLSGERAYDWVYNENTLVGPAPEVGNATPALSRFCSGSLAGPDQGFDRWIYLTNEEEGTPASSFDGKGSVSVAIADNNLYTLPRLGHFAKENTLVQPAPGKDTVAITLEDGPATLAPGVENSQLYMYVGTKDRSASGVLRRNGLDNGDLYVLAPADPANADEAAFQSGQIDVEWKLIPNAEALDEAGVEAASDAAGAFRFGRPEDGAYNGWNRNEFVFVTTGGATGANELGRLYSLRLHPGRPTKSGTLEVLYNADAIVKAGGDIAISPDNIDISKRHLMVQEDGTTESRLVMAAKGRDGSIWRFDISRRGVDVGSALRVVELDPPGRDDVAVGPGVWETSGVIDASDLFGRDTWLFDVQAHPPTTAPAANTVEDGQLLLLTPDD